MPALRIIDPDLWEAVEQRLDTIRAARDADEPDRPCYWEKRRANHLLTQKVHCGVCGGLMTNVGRDYIACASARKAGTCTNTRSMRRLELEGVVLDALQNRVMDPEIRDRLARDLAKVERKLIGLIDAIADGFRSTGLQGQLASLEAQRLDLTAKLAANDEPSQPRLHPLLPQAYRQQLKCLEEALAGGPKTAAALETIRGLIDRIVLTPKEEGGFDIEVDGEAA